MSCRGYTDIICLVEGTRTLYVLQRVHGHYMSCRGCTDIICLVEGARTLSGTHCLILFLKELSEFQFLASSEIQPSRK